MKFFRLRQEPRRKKTENENIKSMNIKSSTSLGLWFWLFHLHLFCSLVYCLLIRFVFDFFFWALFAAIRSFFFIYVCLWQSLVHLSESEMMDDQMHSKFLVCCLFVLLNVKNAFKLANDGDQWSNVKRERKMTKNKTRCDTNRRRFLFHIFVVAVSFMCTFRCVLQADDGIHRKSFAVDSLRPLQKRRSNVIERLHAIVNRIAWRIHKTETANFRAMFLWQNAFSIRWCMRPICTFVEWDFECKFSIGLRTACRTVNNFTASDLYITRRRTTHRIEADRFSRFADAWIEFWRMMRKETKLIL